MARGDKKDYQAATFRLPPELLDQLDIESGTTGLPKGVIVEKALRAYLSRRLPSGADNHKEDGMNG